MALILVRGENKSKLLSAISDMERHGSLTLVSNPKVISAEFADSLVEQILKAKLKTKSNVATAFFVKEDTTLSILKIKQIHPPAHIVVVSPEYRGHDELEEKLKIAHDMDGYRSYRALNAGKIDYSVKGKKRYIQNNKLNSYTE
ncbi:DUF356 domain-containing protein [Methanobrevibacter millerae]|uniref:DUF356 domain-containing protein n=1 Tax=Methanobrevibacter millerae TaxID=230361 RepID=A0A1G5XM05_9EURY|nr:DUF356 domain-containing protein [Methanobrevibacter millerae]SDA71362.1 hypothetical protein SAMN02910315_02355 [Methanobrevibacter millerae]